ncbi:MAG: Wzz/FepE/Etk N-terminal domain-containing protein [Nitrososphaera sp.]|nr:Wzz/FepE/Etk N-terminal domain-containing protein [Nitrososphaera sp.]
MDEMLEQLKIYLRMVWRHRWIALTCAFVVCLIGWIGVAILPNKYESKATLYIDKTSLLQSLLKDLAAQSTVADEMATMMRHALLVRPNLERLAQAAGIDNTRLTPYEFDSAINNIKYSIEITSNADQQGVYDIVYQHTDPRVAHSIARTTVKVFQETLTKASHKDADNAQRFITKQLKEYETKLQEAEQRVKEFKRKNIGLMPDGRSYYARLEDAKNLYRNALLDLNEAEDSASSIRTQLNSFKATAGNALETGGVQNPIFEQETKLAELQLKFTDKHPDVIAAKKVLDEMIRKTSREARDPVSTGERNLNSLDYNPAYQGLKLQVGKADANAAALRARVTEYKRRLDALEQNIETMPQVEAELASLNRDYAVQQDKYRKLAEGREIAGLSDKAGSGKVRVLEQPRLPRTPIWPSRFVFSAAVFAIAVASGVALAFALSLSNPLIYTRRGLEKLINLPVLGTVSYNAGTGRLKPYKPFVDLSFFFGISVLLVLYVTLNAMYLLEVDVLMNLAGFGIVG